MTFSAIVKSAPIYSIADVQDMPNWERQWDEIIAACPDANYRHTREFIDHKKLYMSEFNVAYTDLSFFIFQDGKVIGLTPLLITAVTVDQATFKEASFSGTALPWPCFNLPVGDIKTADRCALEEIERRARQEGAGRIELVLSPPRMSESERSRFSDALFSLGYLDLSYPSHYLTLSPGCLDNVRERYRRYVGKFIKSYDLSVISGRDVTDDLVVAYSELHAKDAGRIVRPLSTYRSQAAMARSGKGFWVLARRKDDGHLAGVLQINVFKNVAYDASVAVDPDFQDDQVSHLMKWKAIEQLLADGVYGYELGEKAMPPHYRRQPSKKNYGISFFKDGWSRGELRTIHTMEKFLRKDYLEAVSARYVATLRDFFQL